MQVFNYSELEEATDNFNSARELGDGGFGTVYYGKETISSSFFPWNLSRLDENIRALFTLLFLVQECCLMAVLLL